jgi:hypothetical protein
LRLALKHCFLHVLSKPQGWMHQEACFVALGTWAAASHRIMLPFASRKNNAL